MTTPNYQQGPAPITGLSSGMKAAWFFVGWLMGIPGLLIAYLTNQDKYPAVRDGAFKFALIGMIVSMVWVGIIGCVLATVTSSMLANLAYYF